MAEIRKDLSNKEEGYCSTHGYDWCECLKAIEKQEVLMQILMSKRKKKKRKHAPHS